MGVVIGLTSAYAARLCLPPSWHLHKLLSAERARAGFAGGDLVFAHSLRSTSSEFQWVQNWFQYIKRREEVLADVQGQTDKGWTEPLKTDQFSQTDQAAAWIGETSDCNEHWLWHGTSSKGAVGITEGDFRISMAGYSAGTLYGRGVYLAEACSKSDEYTQSDEGDQGLRTLLLCRACLGRVNYTAE